MAKPLHRLSTSVTLMLTGMLVPVMAQTQPGQKIDVSKLGPQVGERVPDFSLKDQTGKTWTRQSITGPKGAMLVFVRSADWCPYCKTQLVDLQTGVAELRKRGLGVATISYDPPEILASFAKQHGITYPMLSDAGSATIKKFGLLNPVPEWALGPDRDDPAVQAEVQKYVSVRQATANMVGMAFPGNFILDPQGRVKSRSFEDFYVERNTVSSLLVKLGGEGDAPVAATKISTKHLDIVTYPSDPVIAPGNRFSVVVNIEPHAKMHVYAPGAKDYRVIRLNMDPNPQVNVLAMQYPDSEIYFFKLLNERAPVFQKPFRLVQGLVLDGTLQAQAALRGKDSVTLRGSLEYQACDDKQCFNPVSVPLSWTMKLRPLVLERPSRQQ
jgi:peroxiredoxin